MTKRIFYADKPLVIEALPQTNPDLDFQTTLSLQKYYNKQQRSKIMNPNLVFAVKIASKNNSSGYNFAWAANQRYTVGVLAKAKLWPKISTARRVRTIFQKKWPDQIIEVIEINLSEGNVVKD